MPEETPPILPFIREADFAVRRPWQMPQRRLLDYLLIYVQEGELYVKLDGLLHLFQPGDFCLLQPGDLHTLEGRTSTITPYVHFDIFYNPHRENSFPTRAGQVNLSAFSHLQQSRLEAALGVPVPLKPRFADPAYVCDAFLKTIALCQDGTPAARLEAQYLATGLVLNMLKDHGFGNGSVHNEIASLNWITSYLSFHLANPVLVEDMARRAGLSVSRFHAVFRQRFGCSPHQYLIRLRCHHAEELLAGMDATLQQIAKYCGFANAHHFSRTFKRRTGMPPGAFRAAIQTHSQSRTSPAISSSPMPHERASRTN